MSSLTHYLETRSLQVKLALGFSILLAFAVAVGFVTLQSQISLVAEIDHLYQQEMLGVSHAKDAQNRYLGVGRELRHAALAGPGAVREASLQTITLLDAQLMGELQELRPRLIAESNRRLLGVFESEYQTYKAEVQRILGALSQGNEAQAVSLLTSENFRGPGSRANDAMESLTRAKESAAKQAAQDAVRSAEASVRHASYLLIAGGLVSILIGWLITRSIRRPFDAIEKSVRRLAQGELTAEVPHAEYGNEIGSLARSVQVLQTGARQMDDQNWIKSNLAQISNALQTVDSFSGLSQVLFSQLAPLTHIGHASFYVFEESEQRLRLLGGYALRERKELEQYFRIGQGLVGQCALERAPITLTRPPADYIRITSSLGDATPSTIAVLPIERNDRLLGVLEVATYLPLHAREQSLLDGLLPVLAMNLEILERSVRTHKLLGETQRQAATLEEQAEELEAQKTAIQATETWYRSIIESAPDGLVVVDAAGRIIMGNARLQALFGYSEDELVGNTIDALVPDSVRGHHPALRSQFMEAGGSREMGGTGYSLKGRRKDGSLFPVEVGLSKLPAVGGREACVCASVRDVTALKTSEQAILTSQRQMRTLVDSIGSIITMKDRQSRYQLINAAAAEEIGHPEPEILGKTPHDFLPQDVADKMVGMEKQVIATGRAITYEENIPSPDGSQMRTFLTTKTPLFDERGEVYGLCGIAINITERVQAAAELEERMKELELFNRLTIDREQKMIELKSEINTLLQTAGQAAKYRIVE